jgi:hypothetical protein
MTLTEQGGVTSSVSICDTLCFVANVLVLISNMCFTLERKNLKKISTKPSIYSVFYPNTVCQFIGFGTDKPLISTGLSVKSTGLLGETDFCPLSNLKFEPNFDRYYQFL